MKLLFALSIFTCSIALATEPNPTLIEADFDLDGRTDIALADTSTFGNAGGSWTVCLSQDDGRYRRIGDAFFHPLAFHIAPDQSSGGILTVYLRAGGGDGALVKSRITKSGISEISSSSFRPSENQPDSKNYKLYQTLFGDLREHPLHRTYSEEEIRISGDYIELKRTEQGAAANP